MEICVKMRRRNSLNIAWILGVLFCLTSSSYSLEYAGYKNWYARLKADYQKSLDQFRSLNNAKVDEHIFDQRLNRTLDFTRAIQTFEDVLGPQMQEIQVYYKNLILCVESRLSPDKIDFGLELDKEVNRLLDPRFKRKGSNMTDSLEVIKNQYVELIEKFSNIINEVIY